MASRAMFVAGLVMATMCVAILSSVADDEVQPSGEVTGVVVVSGGATTTELELYRIGDYDPINGIYNQMRLDPRTSANVLAAMYGVVTGSPRKVLSSDEKGHFSLGSLETGGYVIWARDAKGRVGSGAFCVCVEGARQLVRVRMSSGTQSLHATLRERADVAYVGPVVLLRRDQHGDAWRLGRCQTDAKGRLEVRGLPDGDLRLVIATSDGFAAMSPCYSLPSMPEVEWTIASDAVQPIKGRVLADDDGSPIAGATVEVVKARRSGPLISVTGRTNAGGGFLIQMPGRPDVLCAFATGFEMKLIRMGGAAEESLLRLSRLHTLRGRVVRKGMTEGVAGARVMAFTSKRRGSTHFSATTDDEGYFAFEQLATSEWMIFALGNGWVCEGLWKIGRQTYNPFLVDVSDSSNADHVIEVVEAGVLEGKVVDDAGAPVQGAQVIPALQSTPVSDDRPLWAFGAALRVVTGPDGTFRHNGLLPRGTYLFGVSSPGRPSQESTQVVVKAGAENEPLLIRFPAERWIEVQVLDGETGKPVEGARVRSDIVDRWGPSPLGWSCTTGADGMARLSSLPEGTLALFVNAETYAYPEWDAIQVPEVHVGQEGKPFVIRLARGEVVAGKVALPDGVGVAGFKVGAYVLGGGPYSRDSPARTATLDEDGSFRIVGLRQRRYQIVVWRRVEGGAWSGVVTLEAPAADTVIELRFVPAESPAQDEASGEDQDDEKK